MTEEDCLFKDQLLSESFSGFSILIIIIITFLSSIRLIKCTRWAELTESMLFQAELSECLSCPSEFRLINGADPVIVGLNDDDKGESMKFLRDVLSENPAGPTPLCTHITAVVACIASVEKELRANGQKAVVVIATDGESSDGNVAEALRPLTDVSASSHPSLQ